ncbi:MAG: acyl-CoA dehydrogenase [Syntrophales bacterium]
MSSLIVDSRDQQFVLHEMLEVESICRGRFESFAGDTFDMILTEAEKFAKEEIFPVLKDGDHQGCRLENGQVHGPEAFRKGYRLFCEGGWNAMMNHPEHGGQGFPMVLYLACADWFFHNFAFTMYPGLTSGAAELIESYGTEEQKSRYLPKMLSGEWGGTMCLTEAGAGSDVGALTTKAIRQPDGTFLIQGTKVFISCGDHDYVSNMVHPVLARIEGDPEGTKGISIFLVPKFRVNGDGTLGAHNDLGVTKIEEKLGLHGSATCVINFGDNGGCVGELLGKECEGMKIMFMMMNGARMGVGVQGLSGASFSYLQALEYARERLQGANLLGKSNGSVPIIRHPDVKRMLLWMKSHVEAMRALIYFSGACHDRGELAGDPEEKAKWNGMMEVLTPICKAYCSDMAFKVCETAIQVYGGYGFCSEYPVEQILRDEKIGSIYEGTNGIQSLDLVGRKLGMKGGAYFMELIEEMNQVLNRYKDCCPDIVDDVYGAVEALVNTVLYFGQCGREGKFALPLVNAYPFLMMMGKVVSAWFLFWQAGIATEKLAAMGVDIADKKALKARAKEDREAAFYAGKIAGAAYFIKNVLPEIEGTVKAIRREDLSILEIAEESFAS